MNAIISKTMHDHDVTLKLLCYRPITAPSENHYIGNYFFALLFSSFSLTSFLKIGFSEDTFLTWEVCSDFLCRYYLELLTPRRIKRFILLRFKYITADSSCYFVSIWTKLLFRRQRSLAVPTNDKREIHPMGVDRQTYRQAQCIYVLVDLCNFYNYSKI